MAIEAKRCHFEDPALPESSWKVDKRGQINYAGALLAAEDEY